MKNLVTNLVTKDLTTTSLALAELFGKQNSSVNRTIRNVIKDMSDEDLRRYNFALTQKDFIMPNGVIRKDNFYILGEELTLIVTGRFTGKHALAAQMRLHSYQLNP
jgi:phage regulator Rha-like protein